MEKTAITVLALSVNGKDYLFYKKSNAFAIKDLTSNKLFATYNYSELSEEIASIFDFKLQLPNHQDSISQATPPYLFLPYYLDQDGSWSHQWNSFEKLTQFTNWKKPLISYVTGQKPNAYYEHKFIESLTKNELSIIQTTLNATTVALNRIKNSLPKPKIQIDKTLFKKEIDELIHQGTTLKNQQETLRNRAFSLSSQREILENQISLARSALTELEGDLKYLAETETRLTVTCPTCGTIHENGFPVRLKIVDDIETIRRILAELVANKAMIVRSQSDIHSRLLIATRKINDIETTLSSKNKRSNLALDDFVTSKSNATVENAFASDIENLKRNLIDKETVLANLKKETAKYDNPARTKEINKFFANSMSLFASDLEISELTDEIIKRPDSPLKVSGSAQPRTLLAYFYAIIYTAHQWGNSYQFPIVIDSPNQQGQDSNHLLKMLTFIKNKTPTNQQLILAIEELTPGFLFDGHIIQLDRPYGLLEQEKYDTIYNELHDFISEVDTAIHEKVKNSISHNNQSDLFG